jgi:peptidoglycan/LPS O-acetylase OafA/YrhL
MGKYSYSLYVWHTIVFMAAVKLRLNFLPPFEMGALVVFPISALIAAASYRLIEKPFLEMRVVYAKRIEQNAREPARMQNHHT